MTQHLTADLIAEALAKYDEIWTSRSTDETSLTFDHKGGGEMRVTLWGWDHDQADDVEVDARTFRLVEVEDAETITFSEALAKVNATRAAR